MSDNQELNTLLDKLWSSVKTTYDISGMIRELKEKEVSDKDYEILSFFILSAGETEKWMFAGNGMYATVGGSTWELSSLMTDINWLKSIQIHSVKRLLDNEVCTVGDYLHNWGKIDSFKIQSGKWMLAMCGDAAVFCSDWDKAEPPKKPLFTTEDGKEIFEGDWYCYLHLLGLNSYVPYLCTFASPHGFNLNETKTFSSKEIAETYILMNKPIDFSINKLADNLAIWSWGKEIPTEMFAFGKFIKRGLIEIQQKINN